MKEVAEPKGSGETNYPDDDFDRQRPGAYIIDVIKLIKIKAL